MELGFRQKESAFRAHICNPFTGLVCAKKCLEITPALCTRYLDDLCWLSSKDTLLCQGLLARFFCLLNSVGKHPKQFLLRRWSLSWSQRFWTLLSAQEMLTQLPSIKIQAAFVCKISFYDWRPNAHSFLSQFHLGHCLKHRVFTGAECELSTHNLPLWIQGQETAHLVSKTA